MESNTSFDEFLRRVGSGAYFLGTLGTSALLVVTSALLVVTRTLVVTEKLLYRS